MLVPLMGAIFWKPATPTGAMISMFAGCATAAVFMIRDGIDANSPIYYSLAVSLVTFLAVSMLSQPNAYTDNATDRPA
jgi:SSS family solute:Na+ symporter